MGIVFFLLSDFNQECCPSFGLHRIGRHPPPHKKKEKGLLSSSSSCSEVPVLAKGRGGGGTRLLKTKGGMVKENSVDKLGK
jgi:hypothetical protein